MARDKVKYNAYMKVKILERYHKRMGEAISSLGGKCVKCGATEDLEIDHVNPAEKSFTVSMLWSVSKERFEAELSKCQLLCKKCHNEKSILEAGKKLVKNQDVHGTLSSYRYCKCELCRAAKSAYTKIHKCSKH
jgi:5-methylcytosine-specific restriction endonuclease McrA